ncbi:aspartyl-phosphate phosphatase Spo0E family protein [uncultured Clostridium sp.]|uniref:aspartyl-phosphate phosphatase Spo0E family protein n=1 Tax=uncultured Clostridium sp. TaxID=59620 RepID=UPI0025ED3B33|nr:aspartyl-phosphate phosphatase Spo0E family protein [uncultured Clostridium sp.]
MYNDELLNKIARRKQLINLLITFLSPTNSIMVKLSKNLDKLIFEYQKNIYKNYSNSRPILGYLEVSA